MYLYICILLFSQVFITVMSNGDEDVFNKMLEVINMTIDLTLIDVDVSEHYIPSYRLRNKGIVIEELPASNVDWMMA